MSTDLRGDKKEKRGEETFAQTSNLGPNEVAQLNQALVTIIDYERERSSKRSWRSSTLTLLLILLVQHAILLVAILKS